jgi:hypothetical protein
MNDRNLIRGLFLAAVALFFGIGAARLPIGTFADSGPGLFPLMVSGALGVIAIVTIARSRSAKKEALEFNFKNTALLLTALCGFAVVSKLLNMTLGIIFMVIVASIANRKFAWKRCALTAAGLVAIAFAFRNLLGLNLPLI